MKNVKKLSQQNLNKILGRGYQGFTSTGPKPSDWEMALGGTTFPVQGACPSGSNTIGYIGGGQHLCKKY
ncbi:hypothetical protein [Enterococcus sp. DIV0660C]|uniref:hypothetical protein n=1 Tax=Enterococcus sp. DIV0660C TaxID=2230880 RepID=UPI001A8E965D|nr:hypothetical protein [Enterococcus sp. DIV0660C]MBO0430786.1 hypothetical protein [Enterococcus sp. DIV0660C]